MSTFKHQRLLLSIVSLLSILLLTSCNNTTGNSAIRRSTTQPDKTTRQSPTDQTTPSSTISSSNTQSISQGITVTLDRSQYLLHATIVATVTNSHPYPIYTSAYYTNCTPLQLQIQNSTAWLAWGGCSERTTSALALPQASARIFSLHPTFNSPNNLRHSNNPTWTPGTYRLLLHYSLQPDPDTTGGIPATSAVFTIAP